MGQFKFWITYGFRFLIGFDYEKRESFKIHFLCFTFGIGLTSSAKGFGIYKGD